MSDKKIILLAVVGLGLYMMTQQQARAAVGTTYRQPGVNATGAPRYPTATTPQAAAEAATYRDLGSMIGGLWRSFKGSPSTSGPTAQNQGIVPADWKPVPDDGVVLNPAKNEDPALYEQEFWG